MEITVRELCDKIIPCGDIDLRRNAFRVVESARLHSSIRRKVGYVNAEDIKLSKTYDFDGESLLLVGCAEVVVQGENGYTVCVIKCINTAVSHFSDGPNQNHLAEGMCYAFLYACEHSLPRISVKIVYCDIESEETAEFEYTYETDDLSVYTENLVFEYFTLEKEKTIRHNRFMKSAARMSFPYAEYRAGQRTFAEYAVEAICRGKKLFAEAPTGIGKTMSALFPAFKACGGSYGKKIFYFTSKTTIAEAAKAAFTLMAEKGLEASCIIISARERYCEYAPDGCDPVACTKACGHYDRINDAVSDAVSNETVFDREVILKYAEKHGVCPYELSLDISERCELVICDYNYLFDPIVYFRRYFTVGGDYIFLIDEAHNLPERARSMYSHSIKSSDIELLLATLNQNEKTLYPKLYEIYEYMKSAKKLVEINNRTGGEFGVFKSEKPFGILNRKLAELTEAFDAYFRHRPDAPKQLNDIYFEIKKYLRISEYYNEKHVSLIEYRNGDYTFRQICINPSDVISHRLMLGRSAIFFSATLSPCEYYKALLGGSERDMTLTLDSPFPRENLCLATTYKFSTRFSDRDTTLKSLAKLLYIMINSKTGNYMAFFPSYNYMRAVYNEFSKLYPRVHTLLQQSDMSADEREDYLKNFENTERAAKKEDAVFQGDNRLASLMAATGLTRGADFFKTASMSKDSDDGISEKKAEPECTSLLAFGVLGGVFAEGVDFSGEKLIGAAIVGVGLPGINDDSNLVCEYYNAHSDDDYPRGYDYAYRIPGMIKILQAAGRVIRSESDRGVVLLIDDRYASREYSSLYPKHWKDMKLVGDNEALEELLRRFWSKK